MLVWHDRPPGLHKHGGGEHYTQRPIYEQPRARRRVCQSVSLAITILASSPFHRYLSVGIERQPRPGQDARHGGRETQAGTKE
ncbi:hypothetical protein BN2364_0596 [Alloalcanivorax xenomutans]|nr:hypothetical protein BN2364_0596 [Alloalcanivorax xenomutans]